MTPRRASLVAVTLALATPIFPAVANARNRTPHAELLRRLPADGNAAILADVPKLLASPVVRVYDSGVAEPDRVTLSGAPEIEKSREYYRALLRFLDANANPGDPRRAVVWLNRDARAIDELPLLGVDSDLVAFGTKISKTFRDLAFALRYSRKDVIARIAESSVGSGGGVEPFVGGFFGGTSVSAADAARIQRASDARVSSEHLKIQTNLRNQAAELRRSLTLKYMVEF